jgi:hypothetical protein
MRALQIAIVGSSIPVPGNRIGCPFLKSSAALELAREK